MKMTTSTSGQSLVETCIFFLILYPLLVGFVGFSQWIQVRQKVLLAAREAALLYSSGRFEKSDVEREIHSSMAEGTPALDASEVTLTMERATESPFTFVDRVDRIRVRYVRRRGWQRWLGVDAAIEETLYVKHAPLYWAPFLGQVAGPAVPW